MTSWQSLHEQPPGVGQFPIKDPHSQGKAPIMASALRGGGRPRLQQNTQVAVGAPRTLNCLLKHHKVFNLHSTVRNGSEGEGEHRLPTIKEYNYTRLSSIKMGGGQYRKCQVGAPEPQTVKRNCTFALRCIFGKMACVLLAQLSLRI